ncbi:MAG: 30S ribosomal protein S20 [candidate division Zixibacteria bacterium]|nr:30S ribosomal protein S20 [candidate division Zixibacteria bacterium]
MPSHKSCKKRMKTAAVANQCNRAKKSEMRNFIKDLKSCKTKAEAEKKLHQIISIIDKVSRDKVIHKNKAARDKSRLMTFVNTLSN